MIELEEQEIKVEEKPQKLSAIALNDKGLMDAKDHSELMRMCQGLSASDFVPDSLKDTAKLFGAITFVRNLGLPDTAIRQCAVIKGVPSIYGDLPLALVQRSSHFESIREFFIDDEYNEICRLNKNLHKAVYAAICIVERRDCEAQEFFYTLEDAILAGQIKLEFKSNEEKAKYSYTPWAKHPKIMMRYKARTLALKSQFADCLSGVAISEYDFDESPSIREVTPKSNPANDLNGI